VVTTNHGPFDDVLSQFHKTGEGSFDGLGSARASCRSYRRAAVGVPLPALPLSFTVGGLPHGGVILQAGAEGSPNHRRDVVNQVRAR
jgi:hypothetical protein